MSILDGLFPGQDDPKDFVARASNMVADLMDGVEMDERTKGIADLMGQGLTLRNALGLSTEHMTALLTQGSQLLAAGRHQPARDLALQVMHLDPLEARAPYLMGVSFQTEGDIAKAAHFYLQFLALDATNPDGYLRLGECCMAAGEVDNARDALGAARAFARQGKGRAEAADQAERLLATLDAAA
ncbi:tetratricopeptide repeat protein [Aureimonas sp. AU4]|uniref:tetratricopeptide repeat protein n=1 Tax=Aureimonas sp. AU4 TaxID=1638163 RepID=UPI0007818952|nr:tetratricopeptide repeat protein [Aureimonas sp. AU4]